MVGSSLELGAEPGASEEKEARAVDSGWDLREKHTVGHVAAESETVVKKIIKKRTLFAINV